MAQQEEIPDFDRAERHYIGSLLDEENSSPRKPSASTNRDTYEPADSGLATLPNNSIGPSPNPAFWPEPPPPYSPPLGPSSVTFGGWDGCMGGGVAMQGGFTNFTTPPIFPLNSLYYDQCYSSLMKPFEGVSNKIQQQQNSFNKRRPNTRGLRNQAPQAGVSSKPRKPVKPTDLLRSDNKKVEREAPKQRKTVVGWNPIDTESKTPKHSPSEPTNKIPVLKNVVPKKEHHKSEPKKKVKSKTADRVGKKLSENCSRSPSNENREPPVVEVKQESTKRTEDAISKKKETEQPRPKVLEPVEARAQTPTRTRPSSKQGQEKLMPPPEPTEPDSAEPDGEVAVLFVFFSAVFRLVLAINAFCFQSIAQVQSAMYRFWTMLTALVFHVLDYYLDIIYLRFFRSIPRELEKGRDSWDWNSGTPLSVHDGITRLCSLDKLNAYTVLGLRRTTNIEDIKKAKTALIEFLMTENMLYPGVKAAASILERAASCLDSVDKCQKYMERDLALDSYFMIPFARLRYAVCSAVFLLGCDCGLGHAVQRVRTNSEPRYCRKCQMWHPVRNLDVWMTQKWCGLLWQCNACIDGAVYNITEWILCPHNYIKNPRFDTHSVQFRLRKIDTLPSIPLLPLPVHSPCPHKLSAAYCALNSAGVCVRCEQCLLCRGSACSPQKWSSLLTLLGSFDVVSAYTSPIDYFALERPKKAGRRR